MRYFHTVPKVCSNHRLGRAQEVAGDAADAAPEAPAEERRDRHGSRERGERGERGQHAGDDQRAPDRDGPAAGDEGLGDAGAVDLGAELAAAASTRSRGRRRRRCGCPRGWRAPSREGRHRRPGIAGALDRHARQRLRGRPRALIRVDARAHRQGHGGAARARSSRSRPGCATGTRPARSRAPGSGRWSRTGTRAAARRHRMGTQRHRRRAAETAAQDRADPRTPY
jgi:hypothetical protein